MADILVTGGTGQVGTYLRAHAWPDGVHVAAPGRDALDLAKPSSIAACVASRPWAAIINCGAFTAVDRCESEIVAAWQANALGPAALAEASNRAKIPLIHVSTDYVFDGAKTQPYAETDPVGPLGVYGASKEGGEQAVRSGNPRHVIVRTAWVLSPHGHNFVKTMLRMGAERPKLRVVDDQLGSPTHARDLAQALAKIALGQIADADCPAGTFHFTNAGSVTWHGLATEIFRLVAAAGRPVPDVEAIPTSEYPLPARRPANSRLALDKIRQDYAIEPRPWQAAIHDIVAELLA